MEGVPGRFNGSLAESSSDSARLVLHRQAEKRHGLRGCPWRDIGRDVSGGVRRGHRQGRQLMSRRDFPASVPAKRVLTRPPANLRPAAGAGRGKGAHLSAVLGAPVSLNVRPLNCHPVRVCRSRSPLGNHPSATPRLPDPAQRWRRVREPAAHGADLNIRHLRGPRASPVKRPSRRSAPGVGAPPTVVQCRACNCN